MKKELHLTRLNFNREIIEEKTETFSIRGEDTYIHPDNKKGMKPLKTEIGLYLNIGTANGDYKRWYITDTINKKEISLEDQKAARNN